MFTGCGIAGAGEQAVSGVLLPARREGFGERGDHRPGCRAVQWPGGHGAWRGDAGLSAHSEACASHGSQQKKHSKKPAAAPPGAAAGACGSHGRRCQQRAESRHPACPPQASQGAAVSGAPGRRSGAGSQACPRCTTLQGEDRGSRGDTRPAAHADATLRCATHDVCLSVDMRVPACLAAHRHHQPMLSCWVGQSPHSHWAGLMISWPRMPATPSIAQRPFCSSAWRYQLQGGWAGQC